MSAVGIRSQKQLFSPGLRIYHPFRFGERLVIKQGQQTAYQAIIILSIQEDCPEGLPFVGRVRSLLFRLLCLAQRKIYRNPQQRMRRI